MSRHDDQPNASHFSARYAERKRAAERARDAQPKGPCPCRRCGALIPPNEMRNLCALCQPEHYRIAMADGADAAEDWVRSGEYAKKLRGE